MEGRDLASQVPLMPPGRTHPKQRHTQVAAMKLIRGKRPVGAPQVAKVQKTGGRRHLRCEEVKSTCKIGRIGN